MSELWTKEQSNAQAQRILHDAELIHGGASFDENGSFEPTIEQKEILYDSLAHAALRAEEDALTEKRLNEFLETELGRQAGEDIELLLDMGNKFDDDTYDMSKDIDTLLEALPVVIDTSELDARDVIGVITPYRKDIQAGFFEGAQAIFDTCEYMARHDITIEKGALVTGYVPQKRNNRPHGRTQVDACVVERILPGCILQVRTPDNQVAYNSILGNAPEALVS